MSMRHTPIRLDRHGTRALDWNSQCPRHKDLSVPPAQVPQYCTCKPREICLENEMRAWEVEHLADIAWNDWKKRYDVIRAWFVLDYFDDTDLLEGENGVLRQDVERIQGELERLKGVIRRLEEDIRRAGRTVGEPEAESVGYQERQKLMWMEMVRSDEEVKAGETPKEKAKREKIEESEDNSWMNY